MADEKVHFGTGSNMDGVLDCEASLVLTSPPYFPPSIDYVLREGPLPNADLATLADEIRRFAWGLRPVFDECTRVLALGGRLIMQTRDVRLRHIRVPVEGIHRSLAEACGLQLYARHAWRSLKTTVGRTRMQSSLTRAIGPMAPDSDAFLVFLKPGEFWVGNPTKEDTALLSKDVMITSAGKMPARHPHQAPIAVLNAMVRTHSRPGDLVVDPFAGGASTLKIAIEHGRRAWGCEIDPAMLEIARYNLSHISSNAEVQP